jgi:hypothetical protein
MFYHTYVFSSETIHTTVKEKLLVKCNLIYRLNLSLENNLTWFPGFWLLFLFAVFSKQNPQILTQTQLVKSMKLVNRSVLFELKAV